ncbi:MAG: hypothetical protein PHP92_03500 [Candidatus Nanoarchaeia archaeon]|nr:hypothetical protein [Candidatus Nanoarchaeia archaeon]
MKYECINLHVLKFSASKMLSGHALGNLKLYEEKIQDNLLYTLTTEIMSEKLIDREQCVYFRVPLTWFQMFKQQYFQKWKIGRWLLSKYPVKEKMMAKAFHIESYAIYPKLNEVFPNRDDVKYYIKESIRETKYI